MHKIALIAFMMVMNMVAGCSGKPYVVKASPELTAQWGVEKGVEIEVVSHGWHTGLVLPASKIIRHMPQLQQRFAGMPYLEFGWGDKGFYQAKEITSGLTMQAMFVPTESVMHVVGLEVRAKQAFPESEVKKSCVRVEHYAALLEFITQSFARDEQGKLIPTKSGIYGDSQFYTGQGEYYAMNTCNKWTAKALMSAGQELSSLFKLTAGSVMSAMEEKSCD